MLQRGNMVDNHRQGYWSRAGTWILWSGLVLCLGLSLSRIASVALVNAAVRAAVGLPQPTFDLALLEQAIVLEPGNRRANYYAGLQHYNEGQYASSITELERTLQDEAGAGPLTALWLGLAYDAAGRKERAIAVWADAKVYERVMERAQLNFTLGYWQRALADYRLALHINPDSMVAWLGSGLCLQQLGQHQEAIKVLGEALRIDPYSLLVHQAMAGSYVALGDMASAAAWDERAAKVAPPGEAPLYRGRAAIWRDDFPTAIAELSAYTQGHPDSVYAFELLCHTYPRVNDITSAIAACRRYITLRPTPSAWYYIFLGNLYRSVGELEEARQAYSTALQLEPGSPDAQENLRQIAP